jgi:DNA repair ATPase RecN
MIESLHVSGFRLFRDITLPKLGRLNLLVGENNTGKSCLLEAVSLYAGRTPSADVVRVATQRSGERLRSWDLDGVNEEGTSLMHPIFDLFHRVDGESTKRIILEKHEDPSPLRLEQQLVRLVKSDDGLSRYFKVFLQWIEKLFGQAARPQGWFK